MRRSSFILVLIITIFSSSVTACATAPQHYEVDEQRLQLEEHWWINISTAAAKAAEWYLREQDPAIKADLLELIHSFKDLGRMRKRDLESILRGHPFKDDYKEMLSKIKEITDRLKMRRRGYLL